MGLSALDISDAYLLSKAAYEDSDGLQEFLAGSRWQALGVADLPRPASLPAGASWNDYFGEGLTDSELLFDDGNVQAFIARNLDTGSLAISFRGTTTLSDWIQNVYHGVTSFLPEYNQFHYLVESLRGICP